MSWTRLSSDLRSGKLLYTETFRAHAGALKERARQSFVKAPRRNRSARMKEGDKQPTPKPEKYQDFLLPPTLGSMSEEGLLKDITECHTQDNASAVSSSRSSSFDSTSLRDAISRSSLGNKSKHEL